MREKLRNYCEVHHWGIVQGLSGVYCAVFATWDRFHPRAATGEQSSHTAGFIVTASYVMPFWLWAGIVGFSLSVAIPAIRKMLIKPKSLNFREAARAFANQENLKTYILAGMKVERLFSDIQMEAFALARDLAGMLEQIGPEPSYDSSTSAGIIGHALGTRQAWLTKIRTTYSEDYSPRIIKFLNTIGKEGQPDGVLERFRFEVHDEQNVETVRARLWAIAAHLARINWQGNL